MRSKHILKIVLSIAMAAISVGSVGSTLSIDPKGKTVLFFDEAHGNQVEFYSHDGNAFLWYPGNSEIVPGRWILKGDDICFKYGRDTYNSVTDKQGGDWDCSALKKWSEHIVDVMPGDTFSLSLSGLPYRLPAKPKFESIARMKKQAR